MSQLLWATGLIVWILASALVLLIALMLIRHAWNTTRFVRDVWRAQKKDGDDVRRRRLPGFWFSTFFDPPDNFYWTSEKTGKTHIVHWPTRVTKIDEDDL